MAWSMEILYQGFNGYTPNTYLWGQDRQLKGAECDMNE